MFLFSDRILRSALIAGTALAVTACGIPKEQYDKDLADLNATLAKKGADDLSAAKAACDQNLADRDAAYASAKADAARKASDDMATVKKALDDCTNKGGDSAKKYAACTIERDEAKQRLQRVESSINKVRDALSAMSAAGKLQVKVQRGFLVIALQGDILFDSGKSDLKADAKPVLLELATVLKALPDRLFQVAGHTDNAGAEDLNWNLSMQRALTVVRFLIKDGGVDGKNLSAGGYAMYQPAADNGTDEGKKVNRRVEFLLIPNLSEILTLK
jgi:chemotaxis protein MotB